MNKFVMEATKESQKTLTENGAMAYNTTNNEILDFFSIAGALRTRTEEDIIEKFKNCFEKEPELSLRMLFYTGDIRKGLGERRTFRIILKWLAKEHPEEVVSNIDNIPFYNRYDSLFCLVGTPVEDTMWAFVRKTLEEDLVAISNSKNCSLLAKWMPSINTSSKRTRALAKIAVKKIGCKSEKTYRKMLSMMRKYIDVVERKMSLNQWESIDYEQVPSYAMKKYSDAFEKKDEKRFEQYIEEVKENKKKINSSVLYPYDLVQKYFENDEKDDVIELQWKSLPNYVEEGTNILVMADVSGSMYGRPMESSIGLATYFAQHNTGDFRNLYMTFSSEPHFVKLKDTMSLYDAVRSVRFTDVGYSTDLDKAFEVIYNLIIENDIPDSDIPKALVVISDMEIDPYFNDDYSLDFVRKWEEKYQQIGRKMPKLVLWNVESRKDTFLTQNKSVLMVSGQSSSTFSTLIKGLTSDAFSVILEALYGTERYDRVKYLGV